MRKSVVYALKLKDCIIVKLRKKKLINQKLNNLNDRLHS